MKKVYKFRKGEYNDIFLEINAILEDNEFIDEVDGSILKPFIIRIEQKPTLPKGNSASQKS